MPSLNTFITVDFRPDIKGGTLDKTHESKFILTGNKSLDSEHREYKAICFGPKSDRVLMNLEHAVDETDNILFLYYEDIHKRWSYQSTNDQQYFIYKQNETEIHKIKARNLYIRGCYINPEDKYWLVLGYFFNFVEFWEGNVICSPDKQLTNESKLFQLNNSLKKSAANTKSVSIGKSYVIKGSKHLYKLNKNNKYIVKSLSGVRSIVVDNDEFSAWDLQNLNNVPVLFQEKAEGNDLRVHVIADRVFARTFPRKTCVDYRYDASFFEMSAVESLDEGLQDFVFRVSRHEQNELMGIDFIQSDNTYTVLEANPSPGWSAYHECNGIDNDDFVKNLIQALTHV